MYNITLNYNCDILDERYIAIVVWCMHRCTSLIIWKNTIQVKFYTIQQRLYFQFSK